MHLNNTKIACIFACFCVWLQKGVKAACTMAHFPCRNQQCISLDKYCDGKKDCADGSDESSGCSPCNRTYYGRIGSTYKIKIVRPKSSSMPHFCQLTFMASGDVYGDLIQINVEKFDLGRLTSHTSSGCPDGYMQIEELSRSSNSGYWCGKSWGRNVYYSETSSVSIMLRVFNISNTYANGADPMSEDDVLLQLTYKFLVQEKAVLRYGVPYSLSYLGVDLSGTFCDKYFENCDKKNCKVQSPNYPGMYPRNLTCNYHIKQNLIPDGKVALIRVSQENPHLIYIKDQNAPHYSDVNKFLLKDDCHILHDYFAIYDGNSTESDLLLKGCKGSSLSPITSSGPDMMIELKVSPYDYPYQDSPRRRIFGFQLKIEIIMVGKESTAYIKQNQHFKTSPYTSLRSVPRNNCHWEISSRGQRSGYVQAPVHSILRNTTCMWRMIAGSHEIVWLYFLHYRHIKHIEMPQPTLCPNTLSIYDGDSFSSNSTFLGKFCKIDKYPRVCSGIHAPGTVGAAAPCPPSESYVSKSSAISLKLNYDIGTVPAHIEFLARYEFVDLRQWGDLHSNKSVCDRIFMSESDKKFESPKNVFLFGRGGSRKLKCVYYFKVGPHEKISLKIVRSKIGSICKTIYSDSSNRFECNHRGSEKSASIKIVEKLWEKVHLTRACLCNISELNPFRITSYTNELQLVFDIPSMSPAEDFNDYFFEGMFDVINSKEQLFCNDENRQYEGKYGNFSIGLTDDYCTSLPTLVNAQDGSFLYMQIQGYPLYNRECKFDSRINIYAVGKPMPIASSCPDHSGEFTYVFSNGWENYDHRNKYETYDHKTQNDFYKSNSNSSYYESFASYSRYRLKGRSLDLGVSRDLIIEYIGNHSGTYLITWVGVWKPIHMSAFSSPRADTCPHRCPEVEACLPPELWCDGTYHCPSGIDESTSACGILAALPWVSLGVGIALFISLILLLAAVMRHRKQQIELKSVEISTIQSNNAQESTKISSENMLLPLDKETTW